MLACWVQSHDSVEQQHSQLPVVPHACHTLARHLHARRLGVLILMHRFDIIVVCGHLRTMQGQQRMLEIA